MKTFWIILFMFPLLSFGQKSECDCYKVYKGKFYSVDEGKSDTIIYERTKDRQIEYHWDEPEDKMKLNIIWLNECKYILRLYSYNPSLKEKKMDGDVICQIIATNEEFFTVKVWAKKLKKFEMKIYFYPENKE